MTQPLNIVIAGLSITSSWGNGHATNFRALSRALAAAGHEVSFLERDVPWYADHRDLPDPPFARTLLYGSVDELKETCESLVKDADLVVIGSFVPDGVDVGRWVVATASGVTAFYDIDTPVTVAKLDRGDHEYLTPDLAPAYDLYLSFAGGPLLDLLRERYGVRRAVPFYCLFDPESYFPKDTAVRWDLGYLGTYSDDRQPVLESLLLDPARRETEMRFVVAGPQYPANIEWPPNVERVKHLPPAEHCDFYNAQRFTLNVTRRDMVRAGYSPSVRLFEAAACGVPIISDWWVGLDEFFKPDEEIFISRGPEETLAFLRDVDAEESRRVGMRARQRVLAEHSADRRADELIAHFETARGGSLPIGGVAS